MNMQWTVKASVEQAGKVSQGNSKMPGSTFATDAFACKVGSKLAKIKGSVCDGCYAMTGFYNMFKKKHEENHDRKLNNYYKDTKLWTSTFSSYLNKYEKSGYGGGTHST